MLVDISVHVAGDDDIAMGVTDQGRAWLSFGHTVTLFFKGTGSARVGLARALSELRRVERGDLPYNTTDDKIEMPV